MKSEDWAVEKVNTAIDEYINELPNREAYKYQRPNAAKNIKRGDPKEKEIKAETQRMERTRAAALLYNIYQQKVEAAGRYDFSDMILWVIKAFKENEGLLQTYQERFQFVLVDEFQDTSGSQAELLYMLMSYWDNPNLFVVGDDDQSIFAFQGARIKNVEDFYEKYKDAIKVIVLKENYRSSQLILEKSSALINNNSVRLINSEKLKHLRINKNIISSNNRFKEVSENVLPQSKAYYNIINEEADIVKQIEQLYQEGIVLNNVAVLYSQHKQAENIIALMERRGLPYWVKKSVNILELPLIIQIINVFKYIQAEQTKPFSGEELLFEIMHSPFFRIKPLDIAQLSLYIKSKESKHNYWRFLLQDTLLLETMQLSNAKALYSLGILLEKWIGETKELTVTMLLEKIVYDAGIVTHLLKSNDQIWEMQVLHTFFDFIKEESAKQPRISVSGILQIIDKMQSAGIAVPIQKIIKQENGVRFYTAFSAKGHEFEYVFLIGCTKNFWEKKSGGNSGFALPDTLTKTNNDDESGGRIEVMRRVFFVALTRTKKYLQVSYAVKGNEGKKDFEASQFVSETFSAEAVTQSEKNIEALTAAALINHLKTSFAPVPEVKIELLKKELIDKRLENFVLSVSALNKYMNCPVAFYYENILQVPVAKSDAMAFGTAVHYALEQLFRKMQNDAQKKFPSKEEMLEWFRYKIKQQEDAFTKFQYERRIELGDQILTAYYEHYINSFNKIVSVEKMLSNIEVSGVPVKGKLDKIEFDGNNCIVVDYKTGNPKYSQKNQLLPPSEKNEQGGDYWRQIVFYKILLNNYPEARQKNWQMSAGLFDYIEKDESGEFVRYYIPISDADLQTVTHQIK
ncbi:MAG TPA: ATP-dependent DNA helicase, partial [Chitinophagaceae bacterium]|nr:ATP-dependent DNA helicase [Chitinophagaceae bacterium]